MHKKISRGGQRGPFWTICTHMVDIHELLVYGVKFTPGKDEGYGMRLRRETVSTL